MIEFADVSCGYANKPVLSGVRFRIDAGTATCVLGPNGVGKTTLFSTLLGFIPVLSGRILIDGRDSREVDDSERAKTLSYVPQAYDYPYQFTVFDTVLMGRASHVGRFSSPSAKDKAAVSECLEQLDLSSFSGRFFSELSGGEQQIVLIARALAQESRFIVMDEPSSSLDFENKGKLVNAIKALTKNGKGVLMSSHSPELAFECCDKVLLLRKDGLPLFGETDDIMTDDNLSATYGVELHVGEVEASNGAALRACLAEYR